MRVFFSDPETPGIFATWSLEKIQCSAGEMGETSVVFVWSYKHHHAVNALSTFHIIT